jgi:hypothetical protein
MQRLTWWATTVGGLVVSVASAIAGSNLPEKYRIPAAAVALGLGALLGITHPGTAGSEKDEA